MVISEKGHDKWLQIAYFDQYCHYFLCMEQIFRSFVVNVIVKE